MEVVRQQRRAELHAVLLLAEEHGGRATAKEVSQELLQGRPELMGKAIIDRCSDLGLLDESGRITPVGRDALLTGNVFIPERGRYVVWFTEDPLIPQKLVHVEPMAEPNLNDEVALMKGRKARGEPREEAELLPDRLRALVGGLYDLIGEGGGRIAIRSMDPNGVTSRPGPEDNTKITLEVAPDRSRLSVSGGFQKLLTPPQLDFEASWLSALGPPARLWARSRNPPALKCAYDELSPKELASFSKTVSLPRPSLSGFGEFDDASVDGVPIFPRTAEDATKWARWILKRSVADYVDSEQYERLQEACKSRFPDFPSVRLPPAEELAQELAAERAADGTLPKEYWHLQAPLDLQVTRQ